MAILLLVFFSLFIRVPSVSSAVTGAPAKSDSFTPPDNYLLDCGSSQKTTLSDKRVFLSDQDSGQYINYDGKDMQVSVPNADVPLPIYLSAKVFFTDATCTFHMNKAGWHWIRLHFFPVSSNEVNLQQSKFSVISDSLVLLHEFSLGNNSGSVMKEPKVIHYPDGESPLIAPPSVYASAMEMGDANTVGPNFNVTWSLDIDTAYAYLVRLHFADIVSKSLNDLYFNVCVLEEK